MSEGRFQTASGSWTWSVRDLLGPHNKPMARTFSCRTMHERHVFSLERELSLDLGPVNDEIARRLLVDADTCVITAEDDGSELVRIYSVAEHRPLQTVRREDPQRRAGRLRVAFRGRRARRVAVHKPLGEHRPEELLAIVQEAVDRRGKNVPEKEGDKSGLHG